MNSKKRKRKARETNAEKLRDGGGAVSSRYRFFRWITVFFFVAALCMRLDVITVWPGAEGWSLDLVLSSERAAYLPAFVQSGLVGLGAGLFAGADLFFLFPRLLSVFFILAAGGLYYRWGKRLFGKQATELHLLVVASSLWLPFFGKVATADSWALFGHLGLWLSTLLLLRSPERKYQFIQGLFALFSAVVAPWSTVLLLGGLYLGQWVFQRDFPWIKTMAAPLIALAVAAVTSVPEGVTYYFLGGGSGTYGKLLGYTLLGLLPALGFLVGGFRDLVYKLRKGEALAITFFVAGAAAFLAQSLLFPLVLAALAGKQLQLFFTERYPWENWVKGPAILHLIFAVIAAILFLLSGFVQFNLEGYRALLGTAAAYWIFSLLAVLGLYGKRRDFTLGGTVFTGLLTTLFFWVQVYPYLELERDWPEELLRDQDFKVTVLKEGSDIVSPKQNPPLLVPDRSELSNALPYLRRAKVRTVSSPGEAAYELVALPLDTTELPFPVVVKGREVIEKHNYVVRKVEF